jgi:hypothetical protein
VLLIVDKIREISTLSDLDYIQITSTFMSMSNPLYRCGDCYKIKFPKDEIKRKKYEHQMACDYYADKPRHKYRPEYVNKGNPLILFDNCPGNHFNNYWSYWINYTDQYDKGMLPFPGTILEQPSKFVDLMNIVHNLKSEDQQIKEARVKAHGR